MHDISSSLQWRYATKKFDPTRTVSENDLYTLLESARLAPSSLGVQPWKFVVVNDPALRKAAQGAAYGQAQVVEASHFVVFCRRTQIDEMYIDHHIVNTAKLRHTTPEQLAGYRSMITGYLASLSPIQVESWTAQQVHIALGFLLMTAAQLRIDTCPMGGFDQVQMDKVLHLGEKGLTSVALCAIGYRGDDAYASAPKSRLSADEVVVTLGVK